MNLKVIKEPLLEQRITSFERFAADTRVNIIYNASLFLLNNLLYEKYEPLPKDVVKRITSIVKRSKLFDDGIVALITKDRKFSTSTIDRMRQVLNKGQKFKFLEINLGLVLGKQIKIVEKQHPALNLVAAYILGSVIENRNKRIGFSDEFNLNSFDRIKILMTFRNQEPYAFAVTKKMQDIYGKGGKRTIRSFVDPLGRTTDRHMLGKIEYGDAAALGKYDISDPHESSLEYTRDLIIRGLKEQSGLKPEREADFLRIMDNLIKNLSEV